MKHRHRYIKMVIHWYVDSGETYDGSSTYYRCQCGEDRPRPKTRSK